jgi:hypothetical protein
MRTIHGLLLVLVALVAAPRAAAAQGQQEPSVSARLSTGVARLGERLVLVIEVENARDVRVSRLPAVEGLAFGEPEGPQSYRSMGNINGRRYDVVQLRYAIPLRAAQEGEFTIPPVGLIVDGSPRETKPLRLRVVVDLRGADLGFLALRAPSQRVIEGQPFTLELRFGWDASTTINYADLSLPWWGALPGLIELEGRDLPPAVRRVEGVQVNGQGGIVVEAVDPGPGEERFQVFRLVRTYLPSRAGTIEFPENVLEFGRVRDRGLFAAPERTSYFVRAEPFTLEVVPLPLEGQPLDYSSAVGSLAVRASADVRDVAVGESIKFTVEWTGQGNLEFFQAPDPKRIDAFHGFRVFGATEEKRFDLRRVVYDLAPLDEGTREIPPLPLTVFDPERGVYTTISTDPIPIRVRPLAGGAGLSDEGVAKSFATDVEDIDTRPLAGSSAGRGGAPGDGVVLGAALLVPGGWLFLRSAVRRRRGDPGAPAERRRRRARRDLARNRRRAHEPRAVLDAFTTFLAARAREPATAWAGRDVLAWCAAHVPSGRDAQPAAREVAEIVRRLEAAVWGGGPPLANTELLSAAERWEETTR